MTKLLTLFPLRGSASYILAMCNREASAVSSAERFPPDARHKPWKPLQVALPIPYSPFPTWLRQGLRFAKVWRIGEAAALAGYLAIAFWGSHALAQITPDETLGAERSTVIQNVPINGTLSNQIEGGATRGTNLFHSFVEFNVDEDSEFTLPIRRELKTFLVELRVLMFLISWEHLA